MPLTTRICDWCKKPYKRERRFATRFCSRTCSNRNANKSDDPVGRFWSLVRKTKTCWVHKIKSPKTSRYWLIKVNGRQIGGHKFSWELHNGPVPEGLFVLHKCDNTMCVNPDHLFLGTTQDNSDDMVSKGRSARGSKHGNAALTEKDVRNIRKRYKRTSYHKSNTRELALEFGVTDSVILAIVRRTVWTHVK